MNNIPPTLSENPESTQPTPGPGGPAIEEILYHLERILSSGVFSGAARQQRLLRHLVERRLGGKTPELKEYTLGVEVFDRGEDFDPRLDPIVRVEASRLRSRLQKYYDGPGLSDRVRIALPRGGYIPSFEDLEKKAAEAAAAIPEIAAPVAPPATAALPVTDPAPLVLPNVVQPKTAPRWMVSAAIILVAGVGFALWIVTHRNPAPAPPDFVTFRRITSDQVPCTSPSFSPDGKSLVYARRDDGIWNIYRRDLNGLGFTELTPGSSADNLQPAWSPDGKTIAFRSDRDGGGIFLLDVKTRAIRRSTDSGYHPAWSPDSQKIVFSTETFVDPAESSASPTSSLRIVTVGSGQVQNLGSPKSIYDALQPAWSPDGSRIAFWGTDRNGNRDIWTIRADARGEGAIAPVRVTHDTWTDWSATWAPEGNYLYFSSDRGGAMNLWRVRIDQDSGKVLGKPEPVTTPSPYSGWTTFAASGKEFAYVHRLISTQLYKVPFDVNKSLELDRKVQLTAGERSIREPQMSPDGSWIVVRVQDPIEDLALIRPDGTNLHRITNDAFSDRNPHWSPDGKKIVFLSNRSGRFELWSIHPDGSGLRQLTKHGSMYYIWAPDGSLLGYPVEGSPVVIERGSGNPPNPQLPSVFRPMAWSPAKQSVVGRMRSTAFSRGALFIYTPASADYWQIAPAAYYPAAVWLNDGTTLLFSREEGIYQADLKTHQEREVTASAKGEMHSRFTLSPDNRTLYFVLSDDEEDIWVGSQ